MRDISKLIDTCGQEDAFLHEARQFVAVAKLASWQIEERTREIVAQRRKDAIRGAIWLLACLLFGFGAAILINAFPGFTL